MKNLIAYWIPLWLLLSIGLGALGLALHLIVLVHRFAKNLEEVAVTWGIIALLLAMSIACGLGLLRLLRPDSSLITVRAKFSGGWIPDGTTISHREWKW